ncbi:glutamine-hydrolyzing asparagine synthase [Sodiomyces alkalinus F11]|uniref:Glutamine-hydrolyzing asparagine synthase n=1 Tax=Sodiomyces alkalinus (strain CBS 110278 / VKM F-3762 / F11) TaxID=1314773 RepID=A0A3N2PKL9_SODAK|nr:glutamine-hydrolyzing asparagine synthase [Sodiomyces alkalinus F11]ROT35057.1 glutamine-hydrolyzing asparagine synthase [Sodiomyces alkalinus F11]
MCGITAFVKDPRSSINGHVNGHVNGMTNGPTNGHPDASLANKLEASIAILNHRGPDDAGIWINQDSSVGLAHCRLSINDLSPSGRQPLTSDDGEIHAVVNGEIYDHDRLRTVCSQEHGYRFSSESDSELVLALYKIHGAPRFFRLLRGEFSFVLCDERNGRRRVIVGRDRYGIKPMVWTSIEGKILLSSEAKAFLPLGWKPEWDIEAIATSGWQLDTRTLFKGVHKLLPAHWLDITEDGFQIHRYWDAEYEDKRKLETRSLDEMVQGVREKLIESIRLRLRADVPVGIYLSGGIDSSAVAGIVTQLARENNVKIGNETSTKVSCFSVEFPNSSGFDESSIAERTAEWLGVDLVKRQVNEDTLARDFADTAYHCEHHHFDLNCVAKFALSTLPREHGVKVILTGEGADEHFAGYPYFPVELLRETDHAQPDAPLSRDEELRAALHRSVDKDMRQVFRNLGAAGEGGTDDDDDCPALAQVNNSTMPWTLLVWHAKRRLFAPWVQDLTAGLDYRDTVLASYSADVRAKMRSRWHPLHSALYMWNRTTLANVLLSCLGDRTEMAHSVEARTPFLDHHLTEYVNRLPPSVKIAYTPPEQAGGNTTSHHGDQGPLWESSAPGLTSFTEKWILREAVRPFITDELYKRKKHPFLAPMKWPRGGPLHQTLSGMLTREAVEGLGFVDYNVVRDSLDRAFGEEADASAFRNLLYVGAWVTLAERFGVRKATCNESN